MKPERVRLVAKHKYNKNLPGALIMITILAALATGIYIREQQPTVQVGFSQFMEALSLGSISEVTLTNQSHIRFRYEPGGPEYITNNPRRETFKEELLLSGVMVQESAGAVNWQMGLILLLAIGALLLYRRRAPLAASSMSLSVTEAVPKHSFNDMAGNIEAKESVADIVDFLSDPEKYVQYGARMPRGLILHGMPGTGKTLMAKAMAGEAKVPFYAVSGSDFVQMYVGVGAARVRELFKKARNAGKAVIFIDEIDALGKKRSHGPSGGSDERDQTLNALLTEMSGFSENNGIVVIAATNRLEILDEALLRPGRFDRQVEVAMPDAKARGQILELHTKNKPVAEEVELEKWARDTVFFSGAMLEGLVNEAAILAAKGDHGQITDADFEKAYYITLAGYEKKDRSGQREQDRKITAYHEAGHALAAILVSPENTVAKVSIIPSSRGVGGFCVNIPAEKMYNTKQELENQIMINIAGRCAEELTFGPENITTGASNDIEKATHIAKQYVSKYGMCKEIGMLDMNALASPGSDEGTVTKACKNMLNSLYQDTANLLRENQNKLEAIAKGLLEKETLSETDIKSIVKLSS